MIRGQKIELDLHSDSEIEPSRPSAPLPAAFVGDVLEREPAAPKAPTLPKLKSKNGFPEHKKRSTESRFKSQKVARPQNDLGNASSKSGISDLPQHVSSILTSDEPASGKAKSWEEDEKERIDQENRQRMAAMSSEEIEEERRELMDSLGAGFLQKLLARANIESGSNEVDLSRALDEHVQDTAPAKPDPKPTKSVKSAEEPQFEDADADEERRKAKAVRQADVPPEDLLPHDTVHFPRAPQPPELDPSSETFLEDLHQKYFPSLPTDPDKLEWMQSSTPAKNSYDPSASALNAGDIRFNFKGELIPPSKASEIPVTLGLHHHGDAPEAAGYTIAELAHLARSSYPAQRCIAFQTLGRILYRLSKGEFGDPGEAEQVLAGETVEGPEDTFGELARGLWREVERLQVIQILVDEGDGRGVDGGKHMSAKAYATEAVWLWRKGGGRRWKAA